MTEGDKAIVKAILWSFEQLEEAFRVRAQYSIMAIAHPSQGDYVRHTALVEAADVVKDTREQIQRMTDA